MEDLKIIGVDVDLDTNIEQGYLMAEYNSSKVDKAEDGRELIPDGDFQMRFFTHYPDYIIEEAGWDTVRLSMDVTLDVDAVWEMYQDKKEEINQTAGLEEDRTFPTTVDEFFMLACDVDSYMGLE